MKTLLVILFIINGEPSIIQDGFAPMEVDAAQCEERVQYTRNYISSVPGMPELYGVYCGTKQELERRIDIDINSVGI